MQGLALTPLHVPPSQMTRQVLHLQRGSQACSFCCHFLRGFQKRIPRGRHLRGQRLEGRVPQTPLFSTHSTQAPGKHDLFSCSLHIVAFKCLSS